MSYTQARADGQTQRVLFGQRGQSGDAAGLVTCISKRVTMGEPGTKRDACCVSMCGIYSFNSSVSNSALFETSTVNVLMSPLANPTSPKQNLALSCTAGDAVSIPELQSQSAAGLSGPLPMSPRVIHWENRQVLRCYKTQHQRPLLWRNTSHDIHTMSLQPPVGFI